MWTEIIVDIKIVEKSNNGKINMHLQLDSTMQFKLDEINKIKDYLITEVRKKMSKKIFDYVDKTLLAPLATSGINSIASFGTVISVPVRITRQALIYSFLLVMELQKQINVKKKHK